MDKDNSNKTILSLCSGTGAWEKPYLEDGYDVRLITLPEHDVRTYIPPENVYGILAAPPCTEFSLARNGDPTKKTRDFASGLAVVDACLRIVFTAKPNFWAIENPSGYLHRWLGKEDYSFHPWMFGNPWTKRTSLWGKFNTPRKKYNNWNDVPKNPSLYIRPGRKKPSIAFLHRSSQKDCFPNLQKDCETDAEFRAITPPGFARAFFEANP